MDIVEKKQGTVILLSLQGKLDAATAPRLEEKLLALIQAGDTHFVVDLARLDYINSGGLRVLLMAAKRLKRANGRIALASLKAHIREVFEIAGFTPIFPIYAQPDEAVKSFQ